MNAYRDRAMSAFSRAAEITSSIIAGRLSHALRATSTCAIDAGRGVGKGFPAKTGSAGYGLSRSP